MRDTGILREIADKIREQHTALENAIREETEEERGMRVNIGAIFDLGLDEYDLCALVELSCLSAGGAGITCPIRPNYRTRSLKKLEARGYIKKTATVDGGNIYELSRPDRSLKLPDTMRHSWRDKRLSYCDSLVYLALCCLSNTFENESAHSLTTIANTAKCRANDTRNSLRNLEKLGLITVTRKRGKCNATKLNERAYDTDWTEEDLC
jgi:DNA-binding IscR family transcriptional regulator